MCEQTGLFCRNKLFYKRFTQKHLQFLICTVWDNSILLGR